MVVALALAAGGCSPFYVLRAGYEEAKILWRRQPIERVLARPDLDPTVRLKLETVLAARDFARTIGLEPGGSFTSVSRLDDAHTVFVVTAAKQTALEPYTWWFPVVGRVPYKGFFAADRADAEAASLGERGYDTYVRSAAAFSTLGWFADPLLEHLLRHDRGYLVNLVLHEVYHNTFYVPGESAFNESVACFVGYRGAIEFFRSRGERVRLREAEREWRDELRYATFLQGVVNRLRAEYAAAPTRADALRAREGEFTAARAAFAKLDLPRARYGSFLTEPLNNAVLIQDRLYTTDLGLFDAIYARTGGLRAALDFIEAAARQEKTRPFEAVQSAFAGSAPGNGAAHVAAAASAADAAATAAAASTAGAASCADAAGRACSPP